MKKIPMNASGRIGLPRTPAYWVGKPEYIEALELTITAGGGMGGSLWYEYVYPDNIPANTLAVFCDINGHGITINTQYVVTVRKVTIVECSTMCSNPNFYKVPTLEKFRFQIPNGTEVEQTTKFAGDGTYVYFDKNEK